MGIVAPPTDLGSLFSDANGRSFEVRDAHARFRAREVAWGVRTCSRRKLERR
jgi:hypothetical protein